MEQKYKKNGENKYISIFLKDNITIQFIYSSTVNDT